jgi:hypothetical protein
LLARRIQDAIEHYFTEIGIETLWQRRNEIEFLRKAAKKRDYEKVRTGLERLSMMSRLSLDQRAQQRNQISLSGIVGNLGDCGISKQRRDWACEDVAGLVCLGSVQKPSRKRANGRRSLSVVPILFAPESPKNQPKRQWERLLIERLQNAWREATNEKLPQKVNRDHPHLFVRLVNRCKEMRVFEDTLFKYASVVDLYNEIYPVLREASLASACL